MIQLHFRIRTITLDDEEEAANLTAFVSDGARPVLGDLVTGHEVTATEPGGVVVSLTIKQARELFAAVGQMSGFDPRHDYATEIYESLTHIFYGLMGE